MHFESRKAVGATDLIGYVEDALYDDNPYIYQYKKYINFEIFSLGGCKKYIKKAT